MIITSKQFATKMCWVKIGIGLIFMIINEVISESSNNNIVNCGQTVTNNKTFFQSQNFPQAYTPVGGTEACQLKIRKRHNICQVRLDFETFEIDGPSQNVPFDPEIPSLGINDAGNCKTDVLFITSSGTIVSPVCGIMTGQHLYVEFGGSDITIYIMIQGNIQRDRLWNVEILMIPCSSINRAPTGCLQHFMGISGHVRSFNWVGAVHLAKMDYTICIRVEEGMKFIEWSACSPGDVKIVGGTPGTVESPPLCPSPSAFNDYLTIVGGIQYPHFSQPSVVNQSTYTVVPVSTSDRFCDASFADVANFVRSNVRPFMLHFKTDEMEMATGSPVEGSQGFCLKWQQHPQ